VHARNVTIEGRLTGDVSADDRVELVASATVDGNIKAPKIVVAEGTIRGKVNLTSDLRIGTKGRVEATVHARSIVVEGQVQGDVSADDRVELVAGSSVEGNIKAPKIVVAEGAKFRGNVDMGGSPPPRDGADAGKAK
jgi:cytoskeletal protein CcmA (bactofilin family)